MSYNFYDRNEIFLKYLSLDVKDIDDYIEELALNHFSSVDNIRKLILKISKTRNEEEKLQFEEIQQKLKIYHQIVNYIDKFVEKEQAIYFDKMLKYATKEEIIEILNHYSKKHPEHLFKIEIMKDYFTNKKVKSNDNEIYLKYLENSKKEQSIVNLISILFCKSDEEAISLLASYSIPKANFEIYIGKFEGLFPIRIEDTNRLKMLYSMYADKERNIFIGKIFEKVNDIYLSNLCFEEYCSVVGNLNIVDVKQWFITLKDEHNETFNVIIDEILNRDKTSFYKKMNEIAKNIILDDEFDLIKYYDYTKLRMRDFVYVLKNCIEDETIKEIVVKKIIYLRNKFEKNIYVLDSEQILNKEAELNAERIINGRKIETFEKEKIMNFMEENRMHNYYYVYNYLIQKYINGELNIDNPQFKIEI